jgi:GTP-binding protein Era
VARALSSVGAPVWLVLNKIDLVADKTRLLRFVSEDVGAQRFRKTLMIAARTGDGVADLERRVLESLPFSRPLYDEDQFTDR